eukprot:GHVS01027454.1.p1 GENE.GHVS01027454.1~~GHVS01027454.1.p1  ORF type:complete len:806 (+),score=221.75 GHVS01027454.1:79-2496(+)
MSALPSSFSRSALSTSADDKVELLTEDNIDHKNKQYEKNKENDSIVITTTTHSTATKLLSKHNNNNSSHDHNNNIVSGGVDVYCGDKEDEGNNKLILCIIVFTIAYCIQPLLVDYLKYQGAASPSTLLYLLPHYLAMLSVGCIPGHRDGINRRAWRKAAYVSLIDIAHQMAEKAGLVFAGSAVYIIVGSSSIVWTAIISAVVLRNYFSPMQWMSLFIICCGLGIKASSIEVRIDNDEFIGTLLTTGSAILHGLTFVTNEKFLTSKNAVSGPALVFMMGVINSSILLVWTFAYTVPRFNTLVITSIERHNGDYRIIAASLLGLYVCGFVHSCTLWYLLKRIGAVSSGVIKGLKTASVFILSHFLFCHLQASQCLTPPKCASAAVCVFGVLSYSVITARQPKQQPSPTSTTSSSKQPLLSSSSSPSSSTTTATTCSYGTNNNNISSTAALSLPEKFARRTTAATNNGLSPPAGDSTVVASGRLSVLSPVGRFAGLLLGDGRDRKANVVVSDVVVVDVVGDTTTINNDICDLAFSRDDVGDVFYDPIDSVSTVAATTAGGGDNKDGDCYNNNNDNNDNNNTNNSNEIVGVGQKDDILNNNSNNNNDGNNIDKSADICQTDNNIVETVFCDDSIISSSGGAATTSNNSSCTYSRSCCSNNNLEYQCTGVVVIKDEQYPPTTTSKINVIIPSHQQQQVATSPITVSAESLDLQSPAIDLLSEIATDLKDNNEEEGTTVDGGDDVVIADDVAEAGVDKIVGRPVVDHIIPSSSSGVVNNSLTQQQLGVVGSVDRNTSRSSDRQRKRRGGSR